MSLPQPWLAMICLGVSATVIGLQWSPDAKVTAATHFLGVKVPAGFRERAGVRRALGWYRVAIGVSAAGLFGLELLVLSRPQWFWLLAVGFAAQLPLAALAREVVRQLVVSPAALASAKDEKRRESSQRLPGGLVWLGPFVLLVIATVYFVRGWHVAETKRVISALDLAQLLMFWLWSASELVQAALVLRAQPNPLGESSLRRRQSELYVAISYFGGAAAFSLPQVHLGAVCAIIFAPLIGWLLHRRWVLRTPTGPGDVRFDPTDRSIFIPNRAGGWYRLNAGRPLGLALLVAPLVIPAGVFAALMAFN